MLLGSGRPVDELAYRTLKHAVAHEVFAALTGYYAALTGYYVVADDTDLDPPAAPRTSPSPQPPPRYRSLAHRSLTTHRSITPRTAM